MDTFEKLDNFSAAEIRGWDKYLGRGNWFYDEILKYFETDSLNGYFNRYFGYVKDESRSKMDDVYGVTDRFVFVLKNEKNKVVAFSFVNIMESNCGGYDLFIQAVAVHPEERGKGYGRKLLKDIVLRTHSVGYNNINNIVAMIDKENMASLKMFNELGEFRQGNVGNFVQLVGDFKTIKNSITLNEEKVENE